MRTSCSASSMYASARIRNDASAALFGRRKPLDWNKLMQEPEYAVALRVLERMT
ncbi:hypothetical protein ACU4GD_02665 [Cupriavidus basilensis]